MTDDPHGDLDKTKPGEQLPRQFPPKRPLGIALKSLGALLMIGSLLGILFFAWYFDRLTIGPALLMVAWIGGFILFIVGRQME